MVIFTARQNLANMNEVKINLIVKFANLAEKSYICINGIKVIQRQRNAIIKMIESESVLIFGKLWARTQKNEQ